MRSIGAYDVLERVQGQSRDIYLARKRGEQGREFVLALFEVSEQDRAALKKEIALCMRVDHGAVTRAVETFEQDDKQVLVFESVRGASLQALMDHLRSEGEALAVGAILHVGRASVAALDAAHRATDERGKIVPLVHGQLSPYQIFIGWSGEVKLLGVGLATIFHLAATQARVPEEARPYMAPEVRRGGQVTARANVYSVAAIIWALLMDRPPPTDGSKPTPLATARTDVPPTIAAALDAALEPTLTRRTITCAELVRAFDRIADACDPDELRWNIEVFRALLGVERSMLPPQSFPPSGVPCGPLFVRVGDAPLRRWYTPGRPVTVECRGRTELTMYPRPSSKSGSRGRTKSGGWVPDSL